MTDGSADIAHIRTPDQRLRVFVSSTLGELADERTVVSRAVSALRLTPVMFELGARPHPPQDLYRAYLAQSDVFVGLYWQRYGWIGPGMEVSGLEDELERSRALPRLLYVKAPAPDREARLTAMLDRLRDAGTDSYRTFHSFRELDRLVRDDLAVLLSERFLAARESSTGSATPEPSPSPGPRGLRPLPVGTTSLIGREGAIEEVAGLLVQPDVRLVTLTGPGGIGKTRLALAAGERLRGRFGSGRVFVPLAAVARPELAVAAIARAVGADLAQTGSPLEALVEHLADDPWLLVLDNLEQVVEAGPDLDELLSRCPHVEILATSRTALRLRAEREYPVPALPLPPADLAAAAAEEVASSPAVALFVDRARAVRPDFALTDGNAAAVVEICRRLEGLPLAIELAAARTRLLDPGALLDRLATSLDALGTGAVDLPERQRTLRATVDWSVSLLDDAERSLLETAAVFVDGWTVEAVAQVAGLDEDRTLDLTDALARHSLVHLDIADSGPRARMLETVREFVGERLAARPDVAEIRRRHADHYRSVAEEADRPLRGVGQSAWGERLQDESGNLAAAVGWYLTHDPSPLPHLFRILWPFWLLWDHLGEARGWIDRLLPAAGSLDGPARAELVWSEAVSAIEAGDDPVALAASERLGPLLDTIDDPFLRALSRLALAWTMPIAGDFDGALRDASASLDELRTQDEPFWTALAVATVGFMETAVGRHDDALRHLGELRTLGERFDNAWLTAGSRAQLGTVAVMQGRLDDARALLEEGLEIGLATHSAHSLSLCLTAYARLALVDGDPERAALLAGAADGMRRRAGVRVWPSLRGVEAELVEQVRHALGTERFDERFAAGAGLDRQEAVAAVRDRPGVGSRAS